MSFNEGEFNVDHAEFKKKSKVEEQYHRSKQANDGISLVMSVSFYVVNMRTSSFNE